LIDIDTDMQMADTSNTASDWHQLVIHKRSDRTKLHVLILLFLDWPGWQKKRNFCTNITSQGKAAKRNGCGSKNFIGLQLIS